ncbi:hypothetical protein LOTGIDRAFT_179097 [Lottia gigantea]|uniref:Phospholipid-transporting ATPase n=1 Tax=Lottia gigantea TaxID=225164 RepID=V4A5F2_LOTGI|nr:hypothetical protein LOTGIDRAFT_179097 [Lottia gigantea]ESO88481.1 hypothetical protein LOTGIDRAFT_179097 [Lottia gigantea]
MLNNRGPRYKRSKLERAINRDVFWCVVVLLFLCFFCAIGSGIWLSDYNKLTENTNLVPFIAFGNLDQYSPLYQGFIVFWTYVIIFQAVIPLPLYVSVEFVKLGQIYFMSQDNEFYHEESDRKLECRALNITEDLGQLQYIFSDKTGTLTENIMEFKSCTIGGVDYPHLPGRVQEFFLLMAVCNTVVVSHHPHEDNAGHIGGGDQPLDRYLRLSQSSLQSRNKTRSVGSISSTDLRDGGATPIQSEGSIASSSMLSDMSSRTRYEAESPDELALVKAANTYGCRLVKRSHDTVIVWLPAEGEVELEILHILPFDSVRKRMSIILRHPISKEITLYTKGADSAILSILSKKYKEDEELKLQVEDTVKHITSYAMRGLRTLCMAKKILDPDEYKMWLIERQETETSMEERENLLLNSCCKIESDLDLLGATGIEDKLQSGVPQAIDKLRQAGIKVWVLTGDKQETAIQIAYACKLFTKTQEIIILNAHTKEEAGDLLKHHTEQISKDFKSSIRSRNQGHDVDLREYALVIDGKTLTFALSEEFDAHFLALCKKCKSVVCCRATPIQKGSVVKLVKERLKQMTLAIGDGANDVSMIQTADIGVGISGQEGMQAVMASDFSIAQFRFLERLILVHGHWNYSRLARFAAYMFYKNLITVFILFWFQLFSGFSGSLMIDSLYLMLQHVLFTAFPPVINAVLDKDISAEYLLRNPQLYTPCQKGETYTPWTFLVITIDSLYQSLIIYFIPHFTYQDSYVGIWEFGTTICICMILVIYLHLVIETSSWVWIQWLFLIVSFILFWMFAIIFNAIFVTFDHPSNPYWVMEHTISQAIHSCLTVITCVLALLPR